MDKELIIDVPFKFRLEMYYLKLTKGGYKMDYILGGWKGVVRAIFHDLKELFFPKKIKTVFG